MIVYFVKSIILLALLLGLYKLFLENEKMHTFNRYFLLVALVLGLTAPLIQIDINPATKIAGVELSKVESTVNAPSEFVARAIEPIITDAPATPPATEVLNENLTNAEPVAPLFTKKGILIGLYGLVTFFFLIRFGAGLVELFSKVRTGDKTSFKKATIILLEEAITPQSFIKWIFLNKKDFESGAVAPEILEHELTHIRQKHSLDVLFIEFLKTIFWFNPMLYFYKYAIQLNHEFLADDSVIKEISEANSYQKILLEACRIKPVDSVTSKFNQSNIKRRILMLSKKILNGRHKTKQLTSIPLILILSLVFSVNINAQDINTATVEELAKALEKKLNQNEMLDTGSQKALSKLIELAYSKDVSLFTGTGEARSKEYLEKEFSKVTKEKNSLINKYFDLAKKDPAPDLSELQEVYSGIQTLNTISSTLWNQLRVLEGITSVAPPAPIPLKPEDLLKQIGQ